MKRPLAVPSTTYLIGDLSCRRSQRAVHRLKESLVVSLLVLAFLMLQIPLAAQVRQVRRVLILNDLGIVSSPGFAEVDQTIFAGLQKSPYQVELYQEILELTLFPDEVSQRRFREGFIAKYADRKPDVIIAAGSASLKFVAESRERFLRDTPIAFCAILGGIPEQPKPDMHFTGVLGRLHPEETLSAVLHMLPIVTCNHAYMFDWRALQSWRLKESSLPTASTVIFRDLSLGARAKWILITGLLIILFLSALAAYLQHSRAQVRQARDAELELTGLLINAQEKERSRLAAELHDDFSQRLALLAFELEGVEEALPASSDGLKRRIQKAQESASELGADLHTVSHRLHSSTLEALGLVPGVSALCKEFASHQGIPIDFSFVDIPAHVGSDVSLCLFRIVQEALQNLKKHSGAAKAQVMLRKVKDRLFLSVIDEGRGFDIKEAKKNAGLGIGSMQGRARLLGGQFEIQSESGKGTRTEVWVPIEPQTEPMKN